MNRTKEDILMELRYEEQPGEHTFTMCKCGRQGSRSYKCILCLKEELEELTPLRERIADLEHQQWAHWTDYLFKRLSLKPNSLRVDEETKKDFERWVSQIITPYSDLSKKEKDADRIWADKVLEITNKRQNDIIKKIRDIPFSIVSNDENDVIIIQQFLKVMQGEIDKIVEEFK